MIKLSLKNKLLTSILGIILLFGASATYFVFYFAQANLIEHEKEDLAIITTEKARSVEFLFDESALLVEVISQDHRVVDYFLDENREDQDVSILEHFHHYDFFDRHLAIYLMDYNGYTFASTDERFVGNNYGFRAYFMSAIDGAPALDVALGVTSGELGYYFSHPVYGEGDEILGAVIAKLDPSTLTNIIDLSIQFRDSSVMLVDDYGVVLYSNDESAVLSSLGELTDENKHEIEELRIYEGIEIHSLGYESIQTQLPDIHETFFSEVYNPINDQDEMLTMSEIDDYGFYFLIKETSAKYIEAASGIAKILSVFVILAAISAAIMIMFLVFRFLAPLKELDDFSKKFSMGDFSYRLKLKSKDEIGSLADSFNKMADAIQESRAKTDWVVEEQTKTLKTQKEDLETQQKAVLNILEDVSDEKDKTEAFARDLQKFQLAVENVSDHIVITDPEGVCLYVNKAAEKITGFKRDDIIGKKVGTDKLWGGQMDKELYKEMWKTIKVDKEIFEGELKNLRGGRVEYYAYASIAPVLDSNGDVIFFVGIERDITKEREVDRMKSEFISLVSHQLRTPLSAMKWATEMLLSSDMGDLTPEQIEFLGDINNLNHKMVDLVNSLLNISRIESGRLIIEPKPTNLGNLVHEVLKELEKPILKKEMDINFDIEDNLPEINIDPNLISEAYVNLISNSIEYTPKGGQVTISVYSKGDQIVSEIKDTGLGIPAAEQNRVFDRFFRASNVVKSDTEGNGLGVYLVKSIIESSGGKIWFKSKENEGTTFWFSLPKKGSKARKGEVSIDSKL